MSNFADYSRASKPRFKLLKGGTIIDGTQKKVFQIVADEHLRVGNRRLKIVTIYAADGGEHTMSAGGFTARDVLNALNFGLDFNNAVTKKFPVVLCESIAALTGPDVFIPPDRELREFERFHRPAPIPAKEGETYETESVRETG